MISKVIALKNSIKTDKYVYRWFANLVSQPPVKVSLEDEDRISDLYTRLKKSLIRQRILLAVCLLLFLPLVAMGKIIYLIGAALCFYGYLKEQVRTKSYIVEISTFLVSRDFKPAEARVQNIVPLPSLYKIAEIYSRKYNIPSLVDAIYSLDKIGLELIVLSVFFIRLLYPVKIPSLNRFLLIILLYFITYKIANLSFFYKRFK